LNAIEAVRGLRLQKVQELASQTEMSMLPTVQALELATALALDWAMRRRFS